MIILNSNNIFPEHLKGAVIAIGNFDGVHIGHRELIKTACHRAKELGSPVGVVTFHPHPAIVLGKNANYQYIDSVETKYAILEHLGIDFVYQIDFTLELAACEAEEFVKTYLADALQIQQLITGYNYRFGKARIGDSALLSKLSHKYSFKYSQVNQITMHNKHVSSSIIKHLLQTGRIHETKALLARAYQISGIVIEGKKIAKDILGYATANIPVPVDKVLPIYGVYLVKVALEGGSSHYGIANIGCKPTVSENATPIAEVHLFNFNQMIYGQQVRLELIEFMRPERKFSGLDALKSQINMDIKNAHYLLRVLKLDATV